MFSVITDLPSGCQERERDHAQFAEVNMLPEASADVNEHL